MSASAVGVNESAVLSNYCDIAECFPQKLRKCIMNMFTSGDAQSAM